MHEIGHAPSNGTGLSANQLRDATLIKPMERNKFATADKMEAVLRWSYQDIESGRWRKLLYRFPHRPDSGHQCLHLDLGAIVGRAGAIQGYGQR